MLSAKKGIVYTALGILALFVFVGMPGQTKAVGISRPSCPFRITVADGVHELCKRTVIVNHSTTGVSFRRDTIVIGQEMTARRAIFSLTGAVERRITLRLNEKAVIHPIDGTTTLEATYRGLVGGNNFKIEFTTVPIVVIESGSLTIDNDPTIFNPAVTPGTTGVVLFRGVLTAGSPEDILINQMIFTSEEGMPWDANLHNFSLFINGAPYGIIAESAGNTVVISDINFTANRNTDYTFKLKVDMDSHAPAGLVDAQIIGVNALGLSSGNEIIAKDAAGLEINSDNPLTTEYHVSIIFASIPSLSVSIDESTPTSSLALAGTEVSLAVFRFNAGSASDVEIHHINLTQLVDDTRYASYLDYYDIWFEDDAGMEIPGTRMTPTSTKPLINFANGAFVVDNDDVDGRTLNLKAKLVDIAPGWNGVSGHRVGYKINATSDVSTTGISSGNPGNIMFDSALPTGNLHYVHKAIPVVNKLDLSSNRIMNGTNDLARFRVSAIGQNISLRQLSFAITTNVPNVSNLYLYDVTGGGEVAVNDTAGSIVSGKWSTNGSDWLTNFSNGEMTVSTNNSRSYVLRGNLSGVSTGSYIQIKLLGDAAAPNCADASMCSAAEVSADANNNFIWSDKNASAHSLNTPDWTNGYLAKTLPVVDVLSY